VPEHLVAIELALPDHTVDFDTTAVDVNHIEGSAHGPAQVMSTPSQFQEILMLAVEEMETEKDVVATLVESIRRLPAVVLHWVQV
jgi:hypothetical protein